MDFDRATVKLPKGLLSRAKRKALAERRTLSSLVEEGVRRVLDKTRPIGGDRRLLPISDAAGGPLPGIDISDSSALQEMDDLEYVERMKNLKL
jgi:hypothetical protein